MWTEVYPSQSPKSLRIYQCPALCEKNECAQRCYGPCSLVEFLATPSSLCLFCLFCLFCFVLFCFVLFCFSSLCFPLLRGLMWGILRALHYAPKELPSQTWAWRLWPRISGRPSLCLVLIEAWAKLGKWIFWCVHVCRGSSIVVLIAALISVPYGN